MNPRHDYPSRRAGFSLLETLVALVILAVGIVSILLIFPTVLDRQRINTLRTMTTTISQMQLNKMKAGDTDFNFHAWLEENRFRMLSANQPESQYIQEGEGEVPVEGEGVGDNLPEHNYIQSWMVSCQPMGEINQGLYRVTLGLRLWDNRVEYYTTYVTDR